jgi:FMN-dependent NADH-azoreductase
MGRMLTGMTNHLLHIDSSFEGARSTTRALTRRVVDGWLTEHPGGTVTYRDLAATPPPHLGAATWETRFQPPEGRDAEAFALPRTFIDEVKAADTIVLGMPLHNFGPPTTLKAWIDHLIFPGLSVAPDMSEGLLGGRRVVAVIARGGSYAEGTPRHGWEHAKQWLTHVLAIVGLEPEFVEQELTLAGSVPALAHLQPLAAESRAAAHATIDQLWQPSEARR